MKVYLLILVNFYIEAYVGPLPGGLIECREYKLAIEEGQSAFARFNASPASQKLDIVCDDLIRKPELGETYIF